MVQAMKTHYNNGEFPVTVQKSVTSPPRPRPRPTPTAVLMNYAEVSQKFLDLFRVSPPPPPSVKLQKKMEHKSRSRKEWREQQGCSYGSSKVPVFSIWLVILLAAELILLLWTPSAHGGYIPPEPKYKCPVLSQIWPCVCVANTDDGISLKCEDVSLATLSAAVQFPIKEKIPVLSLNIIKLNTEKLYGNLFAGLEVNKIVIEDSPMDKIFPDILYDTRNSLQELEIWRTHLAEFPYDSLEDLNALVNLTLDTHLISDMSKPIKGMTSLKNLRITKGNISVLSKDTFSRLATLDRLDLHGNQIQGIPRDGFKSLSNCRFLDLSYNQLVKLDPAYFPHLTKLTWFNGSHNLIPEFTRGAFARNSFLRVLHLTHNKMTKLDTVALRGMRFLRRLFLSDNQIADVGRGAFSAINRVGTIDLARNRLTFIDYQMFHQLLEPDIIDVSENEITRVKAGAFRDLSYVHINMSHNSISVIEKEAFVSCVNITVLDMSHNKIDNFTKNSFDEFTYPTDWRLEHNKLRSTADIPLKHMSGIKILNVSHNELQEISKNSFPKLYELHTVDFSHNNISKIFSAVFSNLFSVRHLDLSHNNLTEMGALGAVPTLLDLDLSHNRIRRISNAAFTRLASLRELRVTHNNLKSVFQIPPSLNALNVSNNEITSLAKSWPTMNALLRLDVSSNMLEGNLGRGAFENLGTLQAVNLSNNSLTEVPSEALSDLTTVQYVNLEWNNITRLKKQALGRLPVVFHLLLAHNNIDTVEVKAFDGLLQLLHLDLSNNNLTQLPTGSLSSLVSLRKINLSNNHLERTENGTASIFEENLSLETIDLSHNQISEVYYNTFPENRWIPYRLYNIDLSHNLLSYIGKDLLRGTKKLKSLNVSYNRITEIKPRILGNMSSLEILDLSNNEITQLDAERLGPPPNLTEIYLRRNNLRKFPSDVLSRAPLKLIDLSNNRIRQFDVDLMPKIKNGSRIIFTNNPINCDCRLILLKRFYNDFRPKLSNFSMDYYKDFENFKCGTSSSKHHVLVLSEQELSCDPVEDPLAPKIPHNYDLEIKAFAQIGDSIEVKWRVRSKMDVAGFRLSVMDSANQGISEQTFPYNLRSARIELKPDARTVCLTPNYSRREASDDALRVCQKIDISSTMTNAVIPIYCDFLLLVATSVYSFLHYL